MDLNNRKIRISNRETERIQYGFYTMYVPIILLLFILYNTFESKNYGMIYKFLCFVIPYTLILIIYPRLLKQVKIAFINKSHIDFHWINQSESISLDHIVSIEYYNGLPFWTVFSEKAILVKYVVNGKIKRAIIIPTNISKGKNLKRNLNIKGFIENRVNEFKINNKG